jgi:hypothetical protein
MSGVNDLADRVKNLESTEGSDPTRRRGLRHRIPAGRHQQLAPRAEVQHDVRLEGRQSGVKRQIDVLVQEKIGQYEIKIIVDCEDHKTPVDVKGVEEFDGLLKDVGAQRGVLVCPSGFTDTVKRLTVEPHAP